MRNLLTLSAAASVLVIGIATQQAAAFSPGARTTGFDGLVHKIQKGGEPMGPMGPGPGAGKGTPAPGMKGGDRPGRGAGKADGGADERLRDRGPRDDRPRTERRTGVDIDVDRRRDRRRTGRGGADIYVGPGYGYGPGCGWLRRRAMDTGSGYWWRRYRACVGR
jgi:hypothetical protein